VVSKKLPGTLHPWTGSEQEQAKARDGFGMDALTANWDMLGLVHPDNAFTDDNGNIVRIDFGGAGGYTGLGKVKPGGAWGGPVTEDETLKSSAEGQQFYGYPHAPGSPATST